MTTLDRRLAVPGENGDPLLAFCLIFSDLVNGFLKLGRCISLGVHKAEY